MYQWAESVSEVERFVDQLMGQIPELLSRAKEFLASPEGISTSAGGAVALLTAGITHYVQYQEAEIFPVLFAYPDDIPDEMVSDASDFYASVNNMTMSVTKMWNTARASNDYSDFMHSAKGSRLSSFAETVQAKGKRMQDHLEEHASLASDAAVASASFDDSWDYSRQDHYIYVSKTVPDGKGGTKTVTERKYTHTTHNFTFHEDHAAIADGQLRAILARYDPDTLYDPRLQNLSVSPRMDDKKYIRTTIKEDEDGEVSDEEADSYVNQWIQSARVNGVVSAVQEGLEHIAADAPVLLQEIGSSRGSYHYVTYFEGGSHSGPPGYQASTTLEASTGSISNDIFGLTQSIDLSITTARDLKRIVEKAIYAIDPVKPRKVAYKAMDLAVEAYLASFPDSEIDMDQRVKHGKTALIALGSGLAAGLVTQAVQMHLLGQL